jgi:hypothetical protein
MNHANCSLNHANCSLNHANCSLNHTNCSLNHANCSLNHTNRSMNHANCSLNHTNCSLNYVTFPSPAGRAGASRESPPRRSPLESHFWGFRVSFCSSPLLVDFACRPPGCHLSPAPVVPAPRSLPGRRPPFSAVDQSSLMMMILRRSRSSLPGGAGPDYSPRLPLMWMLTW